MKFVHLIVFCALVIMVTACSSQSKASPTQAATSLAPTATLQLPTSAPASPTPTAVTQSTATPPPETAQATFSATATPAAPVASPTPTALPPTEAPAASPAAATPGAQAGESSTGCTDIAVFNADVTVPDGTSFRQGDTFVKTWRIQNAGTCDWGAGYTLVFAGGDAMNAPLSNPLPETLHGSTADVSVNLTAPARGGVYQSNWEFQSADGQRFGVGSPSTGLLWAQIAVSFVEPTQVASSTGTTLSASSGSPTPTPSTQGAQGSQSACPAKHDPSVDAQVLALINQARVNQGLNPLESQDQLAAAALAHSIDMACNNNVSHVGSDGSLWYNRVEAQGYANYNSSRENIYVGHPEFGGTAQGAFDWWWNSKIHHDNMLYPDVTQIGIAYVYDPKSDYGGYYTTVFARP